MANKPSASAAKRARERIREDRYRIKQLHRDEAKARKAQDKEAKRAEARQRKERGGHSSRIQDPAIAGIKPGPQPLPEQWAAV